jgi:hypothetical protein
MPSSHRDRLTRRTFLKQAVAGAEVAPFRRKCHKRHKDQAKVDAFLAERQSKTRPNGRLILAQAMCTDCHGVHVMTAVPLVVGGQ